MAWSLHTQDACASRQLSGVSPLLFLQTHHDTNSSEMKNCIWKWFSSVNIYIADMPYIKQCWLLLALTYWSKCFVCLPHCQRFWVRTSDLFSGVCIFSMCSLSRIPSCILGSSKLPIVLKVIENVFFFCTCTLVYTVLTMKNSGKKRNSCF